MTNIPGSRTHARHVESRGKMRAAVVLGGATIAAAAMAVSWWRDPYDPAWEGTAAYGHNGQGALWLGLGWLALEAVIALLALRPWQRAGYGFGSGVVTGLLLPWAALSLLLTMHAGGILWVHAAWVILLFVVMFGFTVVDGARGRSGRKGRMDEEPQPP